MKLQAFILLLKRFLPHEQSPFQSDLSEIVSTAWYVLFFPVLSWRHLLRQLSVIKEKWMPCRVLPFWTWNLSIEWVCFLKVDVYNICGLCRYAYMYIHTYRNHMWLYATKEYSQIFICNYLLFMQCWMRSRLSSDENACQVYSSLTEQLSELTKHYKPSFPHVCVYAYVLLYHTNIRIQMKNCHLNFMAALNVIT